MRVSHAKCVRLGRSVDDGHAFSIFPFLLTFKCKPSSWTLKYRAIVDFKRLTAVKATVFPSNSSEMSSAILCLNGSLISLPAFQSRDIFPRYCMPARLKNTKYHIELRQHNYRSQNTKNGIGKKITHGLKQHNYRKQNTDDGIR